MLQRHNRHVLISLTTHLQLRYLVVDTVYPLRQFVRVIVIVLRRLEPILLTRSRLPHHNTISRPPLPRTRGRATHTLQIPLIILRQRSRITPPTPRTPRIRLTRSHLRPLTRQPIPLPRQLNLPPTHIHRLKATTTPIMNLKLPIAHKPGIRPLERIRAIQQRPRRLIPTVIHPTRRQHRTKRARISIRHPRIPNRPITPTNLILHHTPPPIGNKLRRLRPHNLLRPLKRIRLRIPLLRHRQQRSPRSHQKLPRQIRNLNLLRLLNRRRRRRSLHLPKRLEIIHRSSPRPLPIPRHHYSGLTRKNPSRLLDVAPINQLPEKNPNPTRRPLSQTHLKLTMLLRQLPPSMRPSHQPPQNQPQQSSTQPAA